MNVGKSGPRLSAGDRCPCPRRGCGLSCHQRSLPRSGSTIESPDGPGVSRHLSRPSRSSASGTLGLRPRERRAWGCDQSVVDDRLLLHRHSLFLEVSLLPSQNSACRDPILQQVSEGEVRGFIRDPLTDQVDACKVEPRRHLKRILKRILQCSVTEVVPLLPNVNPSHGLQRVGRRSAFGACLR